MDLRNKIKKFLYKHSMGFTFLKVNIAINIINECNRKCSFCPYHSPKLADNFHTNWFKNQPSKLCYERFERFLYRIGIFRLFIKDISITGKGEPFLHEDLLRFCELCNDYRIPFSITTNGDAVDVVLDKILKLEYLRIVRVSIYDKKSYEKWKSCSHPKIGFFNQSGVPIEGMVSGYISANFGVEHERAMRDFNNCDFCRAPFNFITVNTDGSVVPCYSFDETSNIDDSWWKIWNGSRIRKYRRQAVNGRDMEFADCNNCGINYVL